MFKTIPEIEAVLTSSVWYSEDGKFTYDFDLAGMVTIEVVEDSTFLQKPYSLTSDEDASCLILDGNRYAIQEVMPDRFVYRNNKFVRVLLANEPPSNQ